MKQHPGHRRSLKNLLRNLRRDERGAVLIMATVYLPVIVGFFTLAVDYSYVLRTRNTLQVTAEAGALAALENGLENGLPLNAANACTIAKSYANLNMPVASYGNVLKQNINDCSDVVLGTWSCPVGQTCSQANFSSAACGSTCNAVQVTTRMSAANTNSLQLVFASMIGWSTFDVSATAIATYGNDPGALPWNVGLVQDVSGSFVQEIGSAKTADQGLASCMMNAAIGSKLGIGVFGETSKSYLAPTVVNGNSTTLTNSINGISVGGSGMPSSAGTDIAAGINTEVAQICPPGTCAPATGFKPAIVLVTDGLPTAVNGAYCGANDVQSCGSLNTQAQRTACVTCINTATNNATDAANTAASLGMDIYAIYYCNDGSGTCNSTANQQAAAFLASLVRGNGQFKSSATAADMSKLMSNGVCKPALSIRLVW